jgi:hypothetical protein
MLDAAREACGNWRRFDSFLWVDRPDAPDDFTIVYTNNRDSDTLTQSNAHVIEEALEPFVGHDVFSEHHNHWACGWIDGFSIRVFRDGKITPAFRAYYELMRTLEDYPILDEDDYSARQQDRIAESWEDWGRQDFEKALSARFYGIEFCDDCWGFFSKMADRANVYWEEDSGGGFSIDMDQIIDLIELDDITDYLVSYVVSWIDVGAQSEDYYDESEAIKRVDQLRKKGFFATYSTPDA